MPVVCWYQVGGLRGFTVDLVNERVSEPRLVAPSKRSPVATTAAGKGPSL
jgi:hypothetical protein